MTLRTLSLALLATLAVPTVAPQVLVYGYLARDHEVAPGQKYREVVVVHNPTEEPQQARLYLRDYAFAADGSNQYGEPGNADRSNADWITFAPPVLTVPAGATIPLTVTVAVPDAPLAGSYWSMLMVETIPLGSAESTLNTADSATDIQFSVTERVRYGIQIASHVSGGQALAEILEVAVVQNPDGTRTLVADVGNAGEQMFRGAVYLDVFDADGAARGRIDGSTARVYPGTSFRHRVDLQSLAPGTYEALFVIDGGDAGAFGSQYTLDL